MASLNLSTNGPSISKSYQTVVNAPPPTGPAASSPTYGQWALFSVTAPLANAFQDSGNKESVLKVQSSGEGELVDLIDDFSDGRIQFAFVKVKDTNTGLPKNALIAWCGEGVPERTKGYFTSHLAAVAKLLHGYHVQITARSDRDLNPESIIQKVADASGAKYSSHDAPPPVASSTKPAVASKPVFTPTHSSSVPIRTARKANADVDEDGWGADAPPVTRTQLEKVAPAYQPTKVDMRDLAAQKPAASSFIAPAQADRPDVVRGAYQPIGKVDIAEIRRQAQGPGRVKDDRPGTVKGAYEPVGKVDIAAIRSRAQKPDSAVSPEPTPQSPQQEEEYQPPALAQRSSAFSQGPERLTSMPKPKVANRFGGGGAFTGTKAPSPGGFEAKAVPAAAPVGTAGRTFAEQGGKTPAQLWAEKKARERGVGGSDSAASAAGYTGALPVTEQKSGGGGGSGGGWESGYAGKKWAPVGTDKTGRSSVSERGTGEAGAEEEIPASPAGGISSIRDRFSGVAPMGAPASSSTYERAPPPPAPEPESTTKPNRGRPIPGLPTASAPHEEEGEEEEEEAEAGASAMPVPPPRQPRSPTPPTPEPVSSPIKVAMPLSKAAPVADAHEEIQSPPATMPIRSLNRAIPEPDADDEPEQGPDPGRFAAQATAASTMGREAVEEALAPSAGGGERARAEFDYDAAEDNEVSFREGEILTNIQKIDPDWWLVTNSHGQPGLVPSNYLQLIEEDTADPVPTFSETAAETKTAGATAPAPVAEAGREEEEEEGQGASATALYDYEAGEDNEISFPENAVISNISFPDEDWWHGTYKSKTGLFPAAYVELKQ